MNKALEKVAQANAHIPTSEIEQDIADTEREIKDCLDKKEILMRNPQDNKVRIYFIEGNVLKRRDFVDMLEVILKYRKEKSDE